MRQLLAFLCLGLLLCACPPDNKGDVQDANDVDDAPKAQGQNVAVAKPVVVNPNVQNQNVVASPNVLAPAGNPNAALSPNHKVVVVPSSPVLHTKHK